MFIDPGLNSLINCWSDTTNYGDKHNNSEPPVPGYMDENVPYVCL
jgi:hypothetical protein